MYDAVLLFILLCSSPFWQVFAMYGARTVEARSDFGGVVHFGRKHLPVENSHGTGLCGGTLITWKYAPFTDLLQ